MNEIIIYTILLLIVGIIVAISWCVPDRSERCVCEGCKKGMPGWLSEDYKRDYPDHIN